MTTRRTLAWLSASLVALAAGCRNAGTSAAVPPGAGDPPRHVVAAGKIEGRREADVISKLPGRILRFENEEGDVVDADAVVVQLEDRDLAANVRQAAARAANAEHALTRMRRLDVGIVSASDLDKVEAEARSADAALDLARVTLDYAAIRAPFRGTIVRKYKDVGEGVLVSGIPEPLFRIADLSRLKIRAEVPETDIGSVRAGASADVTLDAYSGEHFAADVVRVGLAAGRKRIHSDDPRERRDDKVVEVELGLAADARLKSGMTVDVTFAHTAVAPARNTPPDAP